MLLSWSQGGILTAGERIPRWTGEVPCTWQATTKWFVPIRHDSPAFGYIILFSVLWKVVCCEAYGLRDRQFGRITIMISSAISGNANMLWHPASDGV